MQVFLGLGSNLDSPVTQLQQAVIAIAGLPATRVLACSPVYRNPALPLPGETVSTQPDYCNAVLLIETTLDALALLDGLQGIERAQGRVRGERWAARTIDIDLLLYGDRIIDQPRLTVPHPGLAARRFVLQPLADLAPELRLPAAAPLRGRSVRELLAACPPGPLSLVGQLT